MDNFRAIVTVVLLFQGGSPLAGQTGGLVTLVSGSQEECHRPADIMFVLDESGSIWIEHFKVQLNFVNEVIATFDEKAHFGVMTFGDEAVIHFNLNEISDPAAMAAMVNEIVQQRGNTRTDIALKIMRTEGFQSAHARDNVPLIGIVITDGESDYPGKTADEAVQARDAGVIMFAVGVGVKVVQQELENIASSEEYVFRVDGYDALDKLKELLALEACRATTPQPTPRPPQHGPGCRPADVIFALPDEADVRDTNVTLTFLHTVVRDLDNIGPTGIQVGLTPRLCSVQQPPISLSQHDTSAAYRADLQQRYLASSQVSQQVEQLLAGLESGEYDYLEPGRGDVPLPSFGRDVVKIAVLLVDNVPDDPVYAAKLSETAILQGIRMVVVGIGEYINIHQVEALAGGGDNWFHVNSYEELRTVKEDLFNVICRPQRIEHAF